MNSGQLLARLLVASSAATGACSSSGASGQDTTPATVQLAPGPRSSGAAALPSARGPAPRERRPPLKPLSPTIKPGWHATRPPEPPLTGNQIPLRFSATATQPGDRPFEACSERYFSWRDDASGGPFFSSHCYERVSSSDECLAATDPPLRRALAFKGGADCVSDGPYEQLSAESDAPLCCYNTGWFGEGRPLFIAGAARHAPLARELGWA